MKIGFLTSGGDCQALNAAMVGMASMLYQNDKKVEIIGFLDGYKGLMHQKYLKMTPADFTDIAYQGGTILGTSRCPFKKMRVVENGFDKVAAMKKTYQDLKLDGLAILGGNGSLKTADLLQKEDLNVIVLPKTIDLDIVGSDYTFGFFSAVEIATTYLKQISTTAKSHHRVFIVEVMGHKVGWIGLYAGIAVQCDILLLPEIPYDIDKIVDKIESDRQCGKSYTLIVCSEGALSKQEAKLTKKAYKEVVKKRQGHSVIEDIAKQLSLHITDEIRTSSIGHAQRGGQPCSYDSFMAQMFGAYGAKLILDHHFGELVVLKNQEITSIPLSKSAGLLKKVDPDMAIIKLAKDMGISFGD